MATRSAEEQARLYDRITLLFEQQITFNQYMGFRVASLAKDLVKIEFAMRPELIGHFAHGRLHGGVISSVLDVVGGLAVMMGIASYYDSDTTEEILQRFVSLATIDIRVDYLRQGIGERFIAESQLVRLGKRVGVTSSALKNESGKLLATANGSYIVS